MQNAAKFCKPTEKYFTLENAFTLEAPKMPKKREVSGILCFCFTSLIKKQNPLG